MPALPHLISGVITGSNGTLCENALITFTTSEGTGNTESNDNGQYTFNLSSIGFTSGEVVSYSVHDKYNNEIYSGTFTVSGDTTSLSVTLALRTSKQLVYPGFNRGVVVHNIGGEPVSKLNPFPVVMSEGISNYADIDLVNNPSTTWSITRSDGQPDYEEVTFANGDVYRRTFTYNSNNMLITRSAWVKQ